MGRRRSRSRATAGANVLAGRRRAAHHVGPHRDARPGEDAAKPRHLSAAGARARQGDHALAAHARRRARLPRSRATLAGHPVSDRRRVRCGSRDDPGRGDAGPRYAVRVPVRGAPARRAHRDRQVPHARAPCAGIRGDRARRLHPTGRERSDRLRDGRRGSIRGSHRLLQRRRAIPGPHARADHDAARSASTTRRTPANRRTSRRCWASH